MIKISHHSTVNEEKAILSDWKFRQTEGEEWLPAKVPGCVHTDLLKNNLISDPFYGENELDLQWIDKKDWEYEASFDVPAELLNKNQIEIVFDGLDTYAEVFLNDEHLLSADNMFRSWKANVKPFVKEKGNVLRIHFKSPIQTDLEKLEKQGYNFPAVNDHSEDGGVGDKNLSVFARKAPYHYGWDWGPRFVTSGIWKDVHLRGWSEARIEDLSILQKNVTASEANLTALVEIEAEEEGERELRIQTEEIELIQTVQLQRGMNEVSLDMKVQDPKLWWSRGLGDQNMYEFIAEIRKDGSLVAGKTTRTGLRSIKVIREKDDEGKAFYIELNGVPVFAKGANHIPNDSFVTEVTLERYRHEIQSAVESNMNMLRIWGGGIYEFDAFYELCDEYGILVWQDFMFACSMYPGDEAFLKNVKAEAIENVKRLRNHPSIALWCGNNEIDTAWSAYDEDGGWGWKQQYSKPIQDEIWQAYEDVFHTILPEAVENHMPGVYYWPSSPMSDWTGDSRQHTSNTSTSGDIHYWDVWHGLKPFEEYNHHVGRFMSEYGFQSFPELKTVESYAGEGDMALDSKVMLHHQKNGRGNYLIKEYMETYLPEPKDFPSFLYMSHVLQAEGIKTAIEAHRRKKPYCMGTLYWQMNDCWPVASWSSMDYYGRWKALQYYVKRSFQDITLSIDGTNRTKIDIHIISDILSDMNGSIRMSLSTFDGTLLREWNESFVLKSNSATKFVTLETEEVIENRDTNNIVFKAELELEGEIIDAKYHYFTSVKNLLLCKPNLKIEEVSTSSGKHYTLETNTLAKQVYVTSDLEGIFTDNYFDLIPGEQKRIEFLTRSKDQGFTKGIAEGIKVHSMSDFIKE